MAEYKGNSIELLHKTIEEKDAQIQELQKTIQELNITVANLNETLEEFRRKFFGTSRERAAGRVPDEEAVVLCQKKVQVKRELHLNILNYTVSISSFLNSFQYFFSCSFGDS